MWPFSTKKTLLESGILNGFTDWHSHLLPGVDDGVPELEETLEILDKYEELGVYTVWLTPHIMEDVPNKPEDLKKRFEEVQKAYKGKVILKLGAENMMDNVLESRIESKDVIPIGLNNDHLLIETSYFTPPYDLDQIIDKVRATGYFPVLAHPERYVYMDDRDYDRLHNAGVKFQLNLYSLVGMYGPEAADKARKLLKKKYYNVVGTDTHKLKQLKMGLRMKTLSSSDIKAVKSIISNWI